jgi:hypothetical protein
MNPTTSAPRISDHGKAQAAAKGWTLHQVWLAHVDPDVTYPSRREGQMRHIRGNLVVIVDARSNRAITVYENIVDTPLRADQIAKGERKAA